jgi:arginine-tRNA-protein transferase
MEPSSSVQRNSRSADGAMNVVRLCGSAWSECGYCKGKRASIVHRDPKASSKVYSILTARLTPACYERLVYRGWRRSGSALYKPDNAASCCPNITIRLPVKDFVPTKSQRRVTKRMQALLEAPTKAKPTSGSDERQKQIVSKRIQYQKLVEDSGKLGFLQDWTIKALREILGSKYYDEIAVEPSFKLQFQKNKKGNAASQGELVAVTSVCAQIAGRSKNALEPSSLARSLKYALTATLTESPLQISPSDTCGIEDSDTVHKKPKRQPQVSIKLIECHEASGHVMVIFNVDATDSSQISFMGEPTETNMEKPQDQLAAWWIQHCPQQPLPATYKFQIETLSAHESALDPEVHRLYFRYQHEVHGDPHPLSAEEYSFAEEDDVPWASHAPKGWKVRALKMLDFEYNELPQSKKEQILNAFGSFYMFLVENPFSSERISPRNRKLGTYHQHYRIAGLLVAVGVVDILPEGLSSVYLFYNPSFAHDLVPLGKYAILREIDWIREQEPSLPYYYLGYYIESCPKMRYKGDYHPSQLLCPVRYRWVDAEQAKKTIQEESPLHHYCQLYHVSSNGDIEKTDEETTIEKRNPCNAETALTLVQMEVGTGTPLKLSMLHEGGQDVVGPLLKEFILETSPSIAVDCLVDFR